MPSATDQTAPDQMPANYKYWRENGAEWAAEYDRRKRLGTKTHITEMLLCDYMLHHAPARVLEFGCGACRHLRYLRDIPGLDVHGFDQSLTMVAGARAWAGEQWMKDRVRVGEPVGRLPYRDGEFDIVYTAAVLVHVRPEDLGRVLSELTRVCSGHIVHFESRGKPGRYSDDSDGCWKHDLASAYTRLGFKAVDLWPGQASRYLSRVEVGGPAHFTWSPVMLGLYDRLSADLDPLVREALAARKEREPGGA